jgi:hypothetical protein
MRRLADLALPKPALIFEGSGIRYRDTTVKLTAFGRDILEGRANFLDANGIDDWVANVHLDSRAGRVWVHDAGTLVPRG